MYIDIVTQVAHEVLGASHVSSVSAQPFENADGNSILWIEIAYEGLENGPGVDAMQAIVDSLWADERLQELTPVVNFNSAEENEPLEAAE
jgi:hypothetical protein